jgi:hypothetical protein
MYAVGYTMGPIHAGGYTMGPIHAGGYTMGPINAQSFFLHFENHYITVILNYLGASQGGRC